MPVTQPTKIIMSFQFDEQTPNGSASNGSLAATGEVDFGSNISINIPQKKPEKKPVAEKTRKPEKAIDMPAPKLTQGRYVDIGANLNAHLRNRVRNTAVLDDLYAEAWKRLAQNHGITAAPLCSSKLNSLYPQPADAKKITYADKYRETVEGKKLLTDYHEHDNKARSINDRFIRSYFKSTECKDLYEKWLNEKNSAIVVKEVYYIVITLAKSLIAGFYTECVNHRCSELIGGSSKTFEVSVKTVDSLCKAIACGERLDATYPLKQYFATKVLSMIAEFPEKAPTAPGTPAAADAHEAEDEYVVYKSGVDSNDVRYMANIVGEIIGRVNKALNDNNKLVKPDAEDILFRSSQQFKRLIGCAAFDFCVKTITGICEYERNREADSDKPKKGFKVDVEDLVAYLINLSFCTTQQKTFELERAALKKFVVNAETDFDVLEKHKKETNLQYFAKSKGITVDEAKQQRENSHAESDLKAEQKRAKALGVTLEQYRETRERNRMKRLQSFENAKNKRSALSVEQTKKFHDKLAEGDAAWRALIADLKQFKEFTMVAPPQQGLKMVEAAA